MMDRPVCYDVTRLLTRVLNATPNGIDRIDVTLAQHFLFADGPSRFGITSTGFGPRLMSGGAARNAVSGIINHWGEKPSSPEDPVYDGVVARITGRPASLDAPQRKRPSTLTADIRNGVAWVAKHGLPLWRRPARDLPQGCVYFNSSQFPLWVADTFTWLETRRDMRAAFFVHDLLPISMPEYFREAEFERHRKRLANLARFASAAVVTTPTVKRELAHYLDGLGRNDLPIFTAPTPVSPLFREPRSVDPALDGHPFFLLCSTIEPRKNHLMILAAWRELVRRQGKNAPKLVLVGTRGWKYGLILDLIERSPPLRDSVIAVSGLSSPGLKKLMDNATALLMPSFDEGYGLPVHEALAAGCPVVASDIPVFRDIEEPGLSHLSPLDGEAWIARVEAMAQAGRPPGEGRRAQANASWAGYFSALDAFLTAL